MGEYNSGQEEEDEYAYLCLKETGEYYRLGSERLAISTPDRASADSARTTVRVRSLYAMLTPTPTN